MTFPFDQEPRTPKEDEHLICPNHDDPKVRLVEVEDDHGQIVECLQCGYSCQNFLRYPVTLLADRTGKSYWQNVLTGERVELDQD